MDVGVDEPRQHEVAGGVDHLVVGHHMVDEADLGGAGGTGGTEPDADNHAVWTPNPSLVDVATNHIILDITLMARAMVASATWRTPRAVVSGDAPSSRASCWMAA